MDQGKQFTIILSSMQDTGFQGNSVHEDVVSVVAKKKV